MFRHSQVTGLIDNTENSIVSNVTRVVMAKFFTPTTDGSYGYTCSFNNACNSSLTISLNLSFFILRFHIIF